MKGTFGVFENDYMNLEETKKLADRLARASSPQVVFKNPNNSRGNYNITFKERTDQYQPEWVVYETDGS